MSETIKENAQLKMNQIIGNRCKKLVVSGHIGKVVMVNFADGTKAIEFNSKDGEISLTIITKEAFQVLPQSPPTNLTFVPENTEKEEV